MNSDVLDAVRYHINESETTLQRIEEVTNQPDTQIPIENAIAIVQAHAILAVARALAAHWPDQ
jgi:hypothetical protein